MKRVFALVLALVLLSGCGAQKKDQGEIQPPAPVAEESQGVDLMADITAEVPQVTGAPDGGTAGAVTGFGLALLRGCLDGGNTLVSPLSVLEALAMTANGAAGDTLAQLEGAFGADLESLNAWFYAYGKGLPEAEGGSVHLANGIWLNADPGLTVERDFLQTNGTYYNAAVREVAFDPALADEINGWVKENTAGRIQQIIDEVPADAMAYLVNALSFDGVWEEIYRADQVQSGTFTTGDGQQRDAEMMFSTELGYIRDEQATGFIKYYEGRGYAFAALLPEEGTTLEDYVASLTGERLRALLTGVQEDVFVDAAIPKFSAEYGAELSRTLAAMGVTDAFDRDRADFSRLGRYEDGNLYVSRVMHKTFINVDEQGTQAGAATAVEVRAAGLLGPTETVHLDRPFLYVLMDCENSVPIFIGTVTDIA